MARAREATGIASHVSSYIRRRAETLEAAKRLLDGNPVFEAGGAVEMRALSREQASFPLQRAKRRSIDEHVAERREAMQVTPLHAALLALLFVVLSVRTLRRRKTLGIAIGVSGSPTMLRAMRAHSNFAEYAPLSLIRLSMVELRSASPVFVHGLGIALVASRASHAYGVSQPKENHAFRNFGMAMTLGTNIVCPVFLLRFFVVGATGA